MTTATAPVLVSDNATSKFEFNVTTTTSEQVIEAFSEGKISTEEFKLYTAENVAYQIAQAQAQSRKRTPTKYPGLRGLLESKNIKETTGNFIFMLSLMKWTTQQVEQQLDKELDINVFEEFNGTGLDDLLVGLAYLKNSTEFPGIRGEKNESLKEQLMDFESGK